MLTYGLESFEAWAFICEEPSGEPAPAALGVESYRVAMALANAQTGRQCISRLKAVIRRLSETQLPTAAALEKLREMELLQKTFERRCAQFHVAYSEDRREA
jgi:hypothetical protein